MSDPADTRPADDAPTFTRRQIGETVAASAGCLLVLLILYYELPVSHRNEGVAWRLVIGMGLFVLVFIHEMNSILRHEHPQKRAVIALAILLPLFIVVFSWIYLTRSRSDPSAFGEQLNRTGALYFTVTVFSTVGFGDITPKTDPARIAVMVQMVADLALIAVVVRFLFDVAAKEVRRRTGTPGSEPAAGENSGGT